MLTDNFIILPPLIYEKMGTDFAFSPSQNLFDIKKHLMYFKKILMIPYYNNYIGLNLFDPNIHYLIEQGYISVIGPRPTSVEKLGYHFFENDLINLNLNLNLSNDEMTFSNGRITSIQSDDFSETDSFSFSLLNILPLPSPNTEFGEILQFREENIEKLEKLSKSIERIVANFTDPKHIDRNKIQYAIDDIKEECEIIKDIQKSRGIFGYVSDLRLSTFFNYSIPLMVETLCDKLGYSPFYGGIIGGFLTVEAVKSKFINQSNIVPKNFEYAIDVISNFGNKPESNGQFPILNDELICRLSDNDNIITFELPPKDTPVSLPNNPGAFLGKNIL